MFNKVNHLKNLSYYYGKPTEFYEDDTTTGIKYYHWDLNLKHVFLVINFSQDQQTQNIEIVTNKFPTLLEKINEKQTKIYNNLFMIIYPIIRLTIDIISNILTNSSLLMLAM